MNRLRTEQDEKKERKESMRRLINTAIASFFFLAGWVARGFLK